MDYKKGDGVLVRAIYHGKGDGIYEVVNFGGDSFHWVPIESILPKPPEVALKLPEEQSAQLAIQERIAVALETLANTVSDDGVNVCTRVI